MTAPNAAGSPPDSRIGLVLGGRYTLTAFRGSGAMGSVYEGTHDGLGRKVAVKCLHRHLVTSQAFVTRFTQEARLASRLSHPNVVRIYDFGIEQTPGGPEVYLVMEFCSGRQLGELIAQEATFPLARIRSLMGQVLAALAELHDHGIVHRDVKPDNVVLETGPRGAEVAKLIDFGIAELKLAAQRRDTIAGTPGYLSPEVICGGLVDHKADLYAAGCLLFELVTGRSLFEADSVKELLALQIDAQRPDPRVVAPDRAISEELASVCLRAVALAPEERFADADSFAEALAVALAAPSEVSIPPAPSSPPSDGGSMRPILQSAPQIRSSLPGARYAMRPRGAAPSGEYATAPSSEPSFLVLTQIEHDAHIAMTKRRWNDAITTLGRGLELADSLFHGGQAERGAAAIRSMSRRLGEALRREGRWLEAIDVLRRALVYAGKTDLSRALLLEELGINAAAANLVGDAVGAWLDAADVARACGNRPVEQRLLRRIEESEQ